MLSFEETKLQQTLGFTLLSSHTYNFLTLQRSDHFSSVSLCPAGRLLVFLPLYSHFILAEALQVMHCCRIFLYTV